MNIKSVVFLGLILFLSVFKLQAQERRKSFYENNGRLKIDTTYSISKKQLKKFRQIESYLVYNLASEIQYPPQYRRAGVEGMTLYSFSISPAGEITEFKAERIRHDLQSSGLDWVINDTKFIEESFSGKTYIKSLALKKGEVATYYFPVLYTIDNETEFRKIEPAYIHIQVKKVPIVIGDTGPCLGVTGKD